MLKSHAKINLALDILGKDKNYHLVETIICEVPDLYDEMEVEIARDGKSRIEIITDSEELNENAEENSVHSAAKLLAGTHSIKITIKKNIPLRSGLGGGSSNAATVLKELNRQLDLNLTTEQLRRLAAKISMDTPFFITGGIARATHYGEIIEPIKTDLVLKPEIIFSTKSQKNSTGEMFARLDQFSIGQNREKTKKLIRALQENNMQGVIENLHNDFELISPTTSALRLSGSGPTCFKLLQ